MADEDPDNEKRANGISYVLFYVVLFFAYWFGSRQFDKDGDGDFDPDDVQAYLAEKGFLSRKKAPQGKGDKASKRSQPRAKEKQTTNQEVGDAAEGATADGKDVAEGDSPENGAKMGGSISFFDRDGDGDVDLTDMLESKVEGGMAQEDTILKEMQQGRLIPWFIIFECLAVLLLWLSFALKTSSEKGSDPLNLKAGLDDLAESMTDLRLSGPNCEDYRPQAWRWWTYQFTHVGASHALMNCFLAIMLGVPLEGAHGHIRLIIMFNIGVFGGACMHFVNDAHTVVVGCSGGCYALIGIHIGDLVMNWSQKKYRIPTLVFLAILVGMDVGSYLLSMSSEHSSHSAHMGGGIAGVIIGCIVCKNLKSAWYEKYVVAVLAVVGIALTGLCMAWLFIAEAGPLNFWEFQAGETGWCWWRQVWNPEIDEVKWSCVRCGTLDCIDKVKEQLYLKNVSLEVCDNSPSGYLELPTLFATDPRRR